MPRTSPTRLAVPRSDTRYHDRADTRDASIIKRGETVIEHVQAHGVEVVQGTAEAALGGRPDRSRRGGLTGSLSAGEGGNQGSMPMADPNDFSS